MCDLHEYAAQLRAQESAAVGNEATPPAEITGARQTFTNPVRHDQACGRFLARRGCNPITRSTEKPDDAERLSKWFARYVRVPVEMRQ